MLTTSIFSSFKSSGKKLKKLWWLFDVIFKISQTQWGNDLRPQVASLPRLALSVVVEEFETQWRCWTREIIAKNEIENESFSFDWFKWFYLLKEIQTMVYLNIIHQWKLKICEKLKINTWRWMTFRSLNVSLTSDVPKSGFIKFDSRRIQ